MTNTEVILIIRLLHIIAAILMAWPYYALVAVNQRVRLGPPLGDRADTYIENIIKNRTIPCFVFQATVLITGFLLISLRGQNLGLLIDNPALGLKFLLLLLVAGLLTFVHLNLQPRIDALFAEAENPITGDLASQINALRARRKRMALICLFAVLTSAMFGVQVWISFPLWLTLVLIAAIALFTWRAYSSEIPYGWV